MPYEYFVEKKVPYAQFHYTIDGVTYPDDLGRTMPYDEFYAKIKAGATPVTSQVNPDAYLAMFEPILQAGTDIIHITLSSGISGTYNSAVLAGEMATKQYPGRKITIIDSLCASSGYGFLLDLALERQEKGMGYGDLVGWIEDNKLNVQHWVFTDDLSHLLRGGRITRASFFFGTILSIGPLINVNNVGKLIPRVKIRGKSKANKELVKKMETLAIGGIDYDGKCFIAHSGYDDVQIVVDQIEERFTRLDGKVMVNTIGSTIGSHTGPGTVAVFFLGEKRVD